jgi:hypothetical protein
MLESAGFLEDWRLASTLLSRTQPELGARCVRPDAVARNDLLLLLLFFTLVILTGTSRHVCRTQFPCSRASFRDRRSYVPRTRFWPAKGTCPVIRLTRTYERLVQFCWLHLRPSSLKYSTVGDFSNAPARHASRSGSVSTQNRKRLARTLQAVDIGTLIAYKYGDRPWGQFETRGKTTASKKATNKLKKSKKVRGTKTPSVARSPFLPVDG